MDVIESSVSRYQEEFHKNITKNVTPDAIFELEMHKNVFFAAGASPWTPVGKFPSLPRPFSWINGGPRGEVKPPFG